MEKREIDRDRKLWIIPREKTKPHRTLVLPLSAWALEVVDSVLPLSRGSSFVFPSRRETGR